MAKRKKAKTATKASKAAKSASTTAPPTKAKRPDGSISSGIYDAVEKLVADGKMNRTAAFRQIAKESGRKEGTVSVNYYYAAKKRGGKRQTAKATAKATKPAAAPRGKRPDGSVSSMIYDRIEKLVAGGKLTRAAAFRQLANQTGRKEGTVSVNYYYAAKRRGMKPARRGRPTMSVGGRNGASSSRVESVLKSIAELVRRQAAELEALRRENQRFAEIRRLIAR